jgi:N-acetylglucosaminyldiphosphoundecaprenol N-acetyl-beta-D-mannosaminyltransferase
MIDKGKHNLLGVYIDAVDYEAAVAKIIQAARSRRSMAVSALAVHGVMTGVMDRSHTARLNALEVVVPDGQPVRWSLNLLYRVNLPDRVYGPKLTLMVCEQAAIEQLPIYLYGSKQDVLEAFQNKLSTRFPELHIAGSQPSRFRQVTNEEKRQIIEEINASGAAILLVGLGCPRQEVWVYEHQGLINMPMLAVGAAFDFHAGTLSQAPVRLQRLGLEWFYRLINEPKRLWRRYLLLNPYFVTFFLLQLTRICRFDHPDSPELPARDKLRYG